MAKKLPSPVNKNEQIQQPQQQQQQQQHMQHVNKPSASHTNSSSSVGNTSFKPPLPVSSTHSQHSGSVIGQSQSQQQHQSQSQQQHQPQPQQQQQQQTSIPAIIPINYDTLMGHQQPSQTPNNYVQRYANCPIGIGSVSNGSPSATASAATFATKSSISAKSLSNLSALSSSTAAADNRSLQNPSPNALLYQKLLELVSNSADLANQSELSSQMNTLLSNPNIKARLKQLHTQLLKDPNEYWPKLENILLDDTKLQKHQLASKDQIKITQDLLDLKNFYSKEYLNSLSIAAANAALSNSNNSYYNKTQPRIINRDTKK